MAEEAFGIHETLYPPIVDSKFRRLITELIRTLTTEDLADAHFGLALVDRIVPGRFALRESYGLDVETRFCCRSRAAREAVVAAMLLILRGAEADDALGISGKDLGETAGFRPFVEMLRFAGEDNDDFRNQVRKWPGDLQDRAGGALRYLRSADSGPSGGNDSRAIGARFRLEWGK